MGIKGIDNLIKAFASVSDKNENLALVIAGPDPVGLKARLKKLAKLYQ